MSNVQGGRIAQGGTLRASWVPCPEDPIAHSSRFEEMKEQSKRALAASGHRCPKTFATPKMPTRSQLLTRLLKHHTPLPRLRGSRKEQRRLYNN